MKTFTRPVEVQGHWGKGQGVDKNTFLHKSFLPWEILINLNFS